MDAVPDVRGIGVVDTALVFGRGDGSALRSWSESNACSTEKQA